MKFAVNNYLSACFYLAKERLMLERSKGHGNRNRAVNQLQNEIRSIVVLQSKLIKASDKRKVELIMKTIIRGL